jgi:hypothetical protein
MRRFESFRPERGVLADYQRRRAICDFEIQIGLLVRAHQISVACSAAMFLQSASEAVDQRGPGEGFGQEANRSSVQRLGPDALIGKGRDEDERHKVTLVAYNRHKLRTAHDRHLHIRDHTRRAVQLDRLQEILGRRKCADRVPIRHQKILRRSTHRCVIINDGYNRSCCQSAGLSEAAQGRGSSGCPTNK